MWSELQALKARVDEFERAYGLLRQAMDNAAMTSVPADVAERLERLERALKGKR